MYLSIIIYTETQSRVIDILLHGHMISDSKSLLLPMSSNSAE